MSQTAPTTTVVKLHISLNVSDLTRSVAFYRTLLAREPAKQHADYAKFELDDPPLVLSLIPAPAKGGGNLNHAGLRVASADALVAIQLRLESAGLRTRREEGVECCHSRQTKFWVTDPDGTLWEIYLLHEDDEETGHGHRLQSTDHPNAFANDSAPAAKRSWQHSLTDGATVRVPHADNSLHEVLLEGSANLHPGSFDLLKLLRDVVRVLRPGGVVRIHGLSADADLKNAFPSLPGPAAAVQYVPAHSEVAHQLKLAGFVGIQFERLSEKAHFSVDGVSLRELLLVGQKPGHSPQARTHTAIYLGPLASVTDDFGNTYLRGRVVPVNIHDWQRLSNGAASKHFLLLTPCCDQPKGSP